MNTKCLKCARHQQLRGYKTCRDCYDISWGALIQNLSAELELSDEQTAKLVRLSDEMNRLLMGAEETGLDLSEYAEYLVAKSDECADRMRRIWNKTEVANEADRCG